MYKVRKVNRGISEHTITKEVGHWRTVLLATSRVLTACAVGPMFVSHEGLLWWGSCCAIVVSGPK
jgi:hypothetical protein